MNETIITETTIENKRKGMNMPYPATILRAFICNFVDGNNTTKK